MRRKRAWLTPDTYEEAGELCRPLFIPVAFVPMVGGALALLTEHWNWEQSGTMLPERAAEIMTEMLENWGPECMDCCTVLAHNIALDQADDRRVVDGIPQASYDGGETWVDIPNDGIDAIVPPLTPTPGATPEDKVCNAAERATIVMAEFYRQTFGAYSAGRLNTISSIGHFIKNLSNFLLDIVKTAYAGTIADFILYSEAPYAGEFTEATMSDTQKSDLRCLLSTYGSADPSGIVTFDFGAIQTNMVSDVGFNPGYALNMLIAWIGEAGLNRAGNVGTATSSDCCEAGEWCYTWDFTSGPSSDWSQRFSGSAEWDSGQGWGGGDSSEGMALALNTPPHMTITGWDTVTNSTESYAGYQNLYLERGNGTTINIVSIPGEANVPGPHTTNFAPVEILTTNWLNIQFNTHPSAPVHISQITLRGNGENPFGGDNCE